jgi:hypothetical protein
MKGWVRESEEMLRQAREANLAAAAAKESIRKLALIVRDLVFIVRAKESEHDDVLAEHQDRLSEMIGEDDVG